MRGFGGRQSYEVNLDLRDQLKLCGRATVNGCRLGCSR